MLKTGSGTVAGLGGEVLVSAGAPPQGGWAVSRALRPPPGPRGERQGVHPTGPGRGAVCHTENDIGSSHGLPFPYGSPCLLNKGSPV